MVAAVRDAGFGEHASLRERVAAAEAAGAAEAAEAAARAEAEALRERATGQPAAAAADHALHSTPGQREGMAPLSCGRDSFAALQARLGRLNRGMYAGTKLNDGDGMRHRVPILTDFESWAAANTDVARYLPRIDACEFHCAAACYPPAAPPAPVPIVHDLAAFLHAYRTSVWYMGPPHAWRDTALEADLAAGRVEALLTHGTMTHVLAPAVAVAVDACIDDHEYVSTDFLHFGPINGCVYSTTRVPKIGIRSEAGTPRGRAAQHVVVCAAACVCHLVAGFTGLTRARKNAFDLT